MIYLDNGATSFHKPHSVALAVGRALQVCANPGRGGYPASVTAARTVFACRERAAKLFDCLPEQVVFTGNCTHGLNIALGTLVKPESRVLITGFEHNAVTRTLNALGANIIVAGEKLFDPADTLHCWEQALKKGVDVAVFTHVSNVFGYILPVEQMAQLCRQYAVPFVIDAAQSAGILAVSFKNTGAEFIAMPGHKGLLGPQGTGILLCAQSAKPLMHGGTGSESLSQQMPDFLPDRLEAGTLNVPGIAGLGAGLAYLDAVGLATIFTKEQRQARACAEGLAQMGVKVFFGPSQAGTVSFVPPMDCEDAAEQLAQMGIAVRAGLHCAPLAHYSAGTQDTGTVRVSFGHDASPEQTKAFLRAMKILLGKNKKI